MRNGARKKNNNRISRNIMVLATTVVIMVFALVGLSVYAAVLQHANNVLESDNDYIQAEIDSLNSQIVEETKVTKIEQTATSEYGMVYPTSDNCVFIDEKSEETANLASTIKGEAYN